MQGANYPRIGFRISEADIDEMKNAGIVEASANKPCLSLGLASGCKANGAPWSNNSPISLNMIDQAPVPPLLGRCE